MSEDIDKLLNKKLRSPRLDDKLFIEADDWWMNACLDWYNDPTEIYICGYKESADLLVENVSTRKGSADSLIFPIVFLYRHYIELRLKSLLHDGHRLLDRAHKPKAVHQLSKLWPQVRGILEELWPDGDSADLQAMDLLIEQFEEVDPRSTSFRYPKDLKGNNSVKLEQPKLNLRNLAEVMNSISIILEGSAGAISEYQGYKNDMESEQW